MKGEVAGVMGWGEGGYSFADVVEDVGGLEIEMRARR